MTKHTIVHVCDRCGAKEEFDVQGVPATKHYPSDWQCIDLGQTGATLDLCVSCNVELVKWLSAEGASNMVDACINDRKVL